MPKSTRLWRQRFRAYSEACCPTTRIRIVRRLARLTPCVRQLRYIHPQHHAAAGAAPDGRPAGNSGGGSDGSGGSGDDVKGHGGAGAGDVREEEDANFHQYYKISPTQKAFNARVSRQYMKGELSRKQTKVTPDELIGSG